MATVQEWSLESHEALILAPLPPPSYCLSSPLGEMEALHGGRGNLGGVEIRANFYWPTSVLALAVRMEAADWRSIVREKEWSERSERGARARARDRGAHDIYSTRGFRSDIFQMVKPVDNKVDTTATRPKLLMGLYELPTEITVDSIITNSNYR